MGARRHLFARLSPMRLWRLLFSPSYRRARRAEGLGEYREAAALYAQAGATDEAATALLFLAARSSNPEERSEALADALRWLPEGRPQRTDVQVRLAEITLEEIQRARAVQPEERGHLAEAARCFEAAGRWAEAAAAHELLGRDEDAARCLAAAGELERFEEVLERTARKDSHERAVRTAMRTYAAAMDAGARLEARAALREAASNGTDDKDLGRLLWELEAKWLPPYRAALRIDGSPIRLAGRLPAALGRADADVLLRGGTLSRCHAVVSRRADRIVVRDMGSKNGTTVGGVPVEGEVVVRGPVRVGLGEDLVVEASLFGAQALRLEVVQGLDRGVVVLAGPELRPEGLSAPVRFPGGVATLYPQPEAPVALFGRRCVTPVVLIDGDVLRVGDRMVEVSR